MNWCDFAGFRHAGWNGTISTLQYRQASSLVTMTTKFVFVRRFALGALGAAAVVCLTQPALAQTVLKFSLDWKYEGTQAPFLVAQDKGYFRAEGLNVTIDTGISSYESI